MVEFRIGRHGVVLLLMVFVLLGIEDVLIWINSGDLPAIEFFVALVIVIAVLAGAIYEANRFQPPGS